MKVTIKFKSKDKVEPLITFLQELTGKYFKEIKVKSVCSKMERSDYSEIPPNYNEKYNYIDELMEVMAKDVGYTDYDKIKKIINKHEQEKIKNTEVKDEEVLKFPELEKALDEYNEWIIQSSKKRWENYKDFQDKINSLSKVDPVNVSGMNRLFPKEIENYKKLEDKDCVKGKLYNCNGVESVKCDKCNTCDECNQKKDGLAHIIYANGKRSTICDGCRLKNIEIVETPSGPIMRYKPVIFNEPIDNVKELIRSLTDTKLSRSVTQKNMDTKPYNSTPISSYAPPKPVNNKNTKT